jgi:hypothetical protein
MSYTASEAQTGNQAIFAIKTGSSTFANINEITGFTQSGKVNKTADVTNLNSPAEEFINVISNNGNYDLTMNRVSGDSGQAALLAAFVSKANTGFKVTMPLSPLQTTTGDVFTFNALVEEFDDLSDVSSTKQVVTKAKLKVSGAVTLTVGS